MRRKQRWCAALAGLATLATFSGLANAQQRPQSGRVVSDSLWAPALGVIKQLRVYLPPSYDAQPERRYPAVYYLHGWTGNERNWTDAGRLHSVADSLFRRGVPEMIVVMPDGDDSWYTTWNTLENLAACRRDTVRTEPASSYCVPWPHYDDYIANNVVTHVDRTYRTKAGRDHRGIAGLSMGGYGAITLALNNPNVFAAAASHSGVLAPLHVSEDTMGIPIDGLTRLARSRTSYGAIWPSLQLAFGRDTTAWWARDPARIARRAARTNASVPALYMDIGVGDRFLLQNRFLHAELTRLGIRHVYQQRAGGHDWNYWRASVPNSLRWLGTIVAK